MFSQATQLESDIAVQCTPKSINRLVWEILDPRIQKAIDENDLCALRKIESDIRFLDQNLIQYGLYRIQRNAIRIANETNQEKTVRESIREASEEDILFARSMNGEDILDFAEKVWQEIRKWILAKDVPEDIMRMIEDQQALAHGGTLLMCKKELDEFAAADLINSFRRSSILLHARQAKEIALGVSGGRK